MARTPENDTSTAGTNCAVRNGMSNNHGMKTKGSSAAATTIKSSNVTTVAAPTKRGTDNQILARSDADYVRASTTVARMPSRARDDGPTTEHYSTKRQANNNSHAPPSSSYQHGWNDSRGGARRGGGQNYGRGGFHHSRPHENQHKQRGRYEDRRRPDREDRRDGEHGRRSEYDNRQCKDDGKWGREREGWNRPNHFDDRPRDRHHGGKFSRHSQNYSSQNKRPKYGHNKNQSSWQRQGSRQRQKQQNPRDIEIQAMQTNMARLQKELDDVKEKQRSVAPALSNNAGAQYTEGRVMQYPTVSIGSTARAAEQQHRSENSRVANFSTQIPSMVHAQSTAGSSMHNAADPTGSPVNTMQQRPAPESTNATVGFSTNSEQNQTDPPRDANIADATFEASHDQESSCYEASTDEDEENFPPPNASADASTDNVGKDDEKEDEVESDDDLHDPGKNADNHATSNATSNAINNSTNAGGDNNAANNQAVGNSTIAGDESDDEDSVDLVLRDDYDYNGRVAFCCQNCRCWELSQTKFLKCSQIRNNCGNSGYKEGGNIKLYHRGCCHGDTKFTHDYLTSMAKAIEKNFDEKEKKEKEEEKKKKKKKKSRSESKTEIAKAYNTAMREESKYENEESDVDMVCQNFCNSAYISSCAKFQQREKTRRNPLRVLECFTGIGSGTATLKKLRLPIHTVVHIEHDPVAVAVCKFNNQNDGINHIYIETFEEIYGTNDEADDELVAALVGEHGPFDLVLSGAPCQNYSGLNASRDSKSENAQYLKKVGRLIQKIDHIQLGSNGVNDHVLFLSENVVFKEHGEVDKTYTDRVEGLSPIRQDAKDFGPMKRNRFYWMNIPVNNSVQIKEVASQVSVDHLLDEGYGAVARLLPGGDKGVTVKANAFLASLSRIDDNRMNRYKIEDGPNSRGEYLIESYSVGERERMMGLPTGYVEKPLRKLFSELTTNAFLLPETSEEGKTYRDFLPHEFWHYRKKCHFKFQPNPECPFFHLAVSSPLEGKSQLAFYTEEQYCKHLIGNGWSIPTSAYLLGMLSELFADDALITYDGYSYQFPWEPYMSM